MVNEAQHNLGIESDMRKTMISSLRSVWPEGLPSIKEVSMKVDDIFEDNHLEAMSVEILIQRLRELPVEPLIAFFGDIGLLKILKEEEPAILHPLRIDEQNRVVYYGSISGSRLARRKQKCYKDKLHDQLDCFIFESMTMKNAIEKFVFNTKNRTERMSQIALTVLQRRPQVFKLDRLDEEGTIVRIEELRVTSSQEADW